jgi:predicted nuclease of predicted toxin-antitoxin system
MTKFLIDENVNQRVIRSIPTAAKGFDVMYPEQMGSKGIVDSAVRKLAIHEGRILVTCDRDFSFVNLPAGHLGKGILWIRPSPRVSQKRVGDLVRRLCQLLTKTFPDNPYDFDGKLVEVHETGVKITPQNGPSIVYPFD